MYSTWFISQKINITPNMHVKIDKILVKSEVVDYLSRPHWTMSTI